MEEVMKKVKRLDGKTVSEQYIALLSMDYSEPEI